MAPPRKPLYRRALPRDEFPGSSYQKNNTSHNRVQRYKQKRNQAFNHNPRYSDLVDRDPRGPDLKETRHHYLDINEMPHAVERATKVQKLLQEDAVGLRAYEAPHLACPLKFELVRSALDLKNSEIDACLSLVERTSGKDYRASTIGWNPRKKRLEMADKEMIYLLVRQGDIGAVTEETIEGAQEQDTVMEDQVTPQLDTLEQLICAYASDSDEGEAITPKDPAKLEAMGCELPDDDASPNHQPVKKLEWPHPSNNGMILGFISFMFTYDDPPHEDREVVYVYEIHLHERLRGRGLGSNLIKFVEHAAYHCGIAKTMLTVFVANEGAIALYEKLGYGKDECSPKDRVMRRKVVKADYLIMSKELA